MIRSPVGVWCTAAALALVALVPVGLRASSAYAKASASQARLDRLTVQSGELTRLRSSVPAWLSRSSPTPRGTAESMLTPRFTAALTSAGLPTSGGTLTGLSADTGTDLFASGSALKAKKRHASASLSGLTLPQLGKVLDQWRRANPSWTLTALDLSPVQGQGASTALAPTGGDMPLKVNLTLENIALEGAASSPSPEGTKR